MIIFHEKIELQKNMDICLTKIHIIDDNRSFGKSLKRLLNTRGIVADYFESAQAFLDSVPSGQKGIAIVDLHMPENDGFELLTMMQEMHYIMPVILITGQTSNDTRDMALRKGAIGFLQKPFTEQSLFELVALSEIEVKNK